MACMCHTSLKYLSWTVVDTNYCGAQDLEARGGLPEDMRVLRALWNIFNAFAEPREELLEAAADQAAQGASASSPIANGAHTRHTVFVLLNCIQSMSFKPCCGGGKDMLSNGG